MTALLDTGGLMLRSTADQHVTEGCAQWDIWENYTPAQKDNLMSFAMSSMDALQVTPATYQINLLMTRIPSNGSSGPGRSAQAP
jgi:hypothetical protein